MELIITILGFGNVGKTIGALLLPYKSFKSTIHIMDTDDHVSGALLDLRQGAQLYPNHEIVFNDPQLLNASDFIFHCAGASVPVGESRLTTCQASIEITEAIFKDFKSTKNPFIIVVTNPVEIITFITQKITGLPKTNVIGTGTFLDSIRMDYFTKKVWPDLDSVNTIVLGEHGNSAFLSQQLSYVNGLPFHTMMDEHATNQLMDLVKSSAEKIKETQGATIYGVGYCAIKIFESLLSPMGKKLAVSTFIPAELSTQIGESEIYLSLYSEINASGAHPLTDYLPDLKEKESLIQSTRIIKRNIPTKYLSTHL